MAENAPGGRTRALPGAVDPALLDRLKEAPAVPLTVLAQAGIQQLISGPVMVVGGALSNVGAARDELQLIDGTDVNGAPAGKFGIVAGGGAVFGPDSEGPVYRHGLSCTETGGNISGCFWVKF